MFCNILKFCQYTVDYFSYKQRLADLLEVDIKTIESFYNELRGADFISAIKKKTGSKGNFFDFGMLNFMRAPLLYVVCRFLRPEIVVETGVANGFSSSFILQALEKNKRGRLWSIDLPNRPGEEIAHSAGWLVPDNLRVKWELIIGDSKEKLPQLVNELKKINIFFHDSDHSYGNVLFELNAVWDNIARGGVVLADDITMSNAFVDFSAKERLNYAKFYRLGVAKKI